VFSSIKTKESKIFSETSEEQEFRQILMAIIPKPKKVPVSLFFTLVRLIFFIKMPYKII
jgi:hypothetical protein